MFYFYFVIAIIDDIIIIVLLKFHNYKMTVIMYMPLIKLVDNVKYFIKTLNSYTHHRQYN